MKRRILLICVLVLVILAAGFTVFAVWYHKPVERSVTMTACTTDGETAELELNLIYLPQFPETDFYWRYDSVRRSDLCGLRAEVRRCRRKS